MENKSIAIFIDAENIPAKYAKHIFDIASDYREVITTNRKYSDFHPQNYGFKNFRALIQKFLPKMKKFEEEREKIYIFW